MSHDPAITGRPQLLTITADPRQQDGVLVLGIAGEVDLYTVDALRRHLTERLAESWRGLILDLSEVTFLAAAGSTHWLKPPSGRRRMGWRYAWYQARPVLCGVR